MFKLDKDEIEKLNKWLKKHKKKCKLKNPLLTYSFKPTGIGIIKTVICDCGKEKDLTDVSKW